MNKHDQNRLMFLSRNGRQLSAFNPTRVTMDDRKNYLKKKLSTDDKWSQRALMRIFERQTEEEKQSDSTTVFNKIGFTGFDAQILSSFVKQLEKWKTLSPKQNAILRRMMPKYWKQIYHIADKEKLDKNVVEWKSQEQPDLIKMSCRTGYVNVISVKLASIAEALIG